MTGMTVTTRWVISTLNGTTNMDTIDIFISRLSKAERDFYEECAQRAGVSLREWIAHMDEI